jgi:hypothetical protein
MSLPDNYRKKSFLEFNVPIDLQSLLEEYKSIPSSAWLSSYWGKFHCSVGMFLLRGGTTGTEDDFWTEEEVQDNPLLLEMRTFRALLNEPFGIARYAFLFRMRPDGVTLRHRDRGPVWHSMYRIHVPLITNEGAFLISGQRSLHLSAGKAWTFDNSEDHGVVNGPQERVHLIFDVPFKPTLQERIDEAKFHAGEVCPKHLEKIDATHAHATASYPGDREIADMIARCRKDGLTDDRTANLLNERKVPTKEYFLAEHEQEVGWTPELVAARAHPDTSG